MRLQHAMQATGDWLKLLRNAMAPYCNHPCALLSLHVAAGAYMACAKMRLMYNRQDALIIHSILACCDAQ